MLDLLWTEYRKSDAAARAAARFEVSVHEQQLQDRLAEGYDEDEAGELRQVFRADDFNTTFRQLLQLRMERQLLRELELGDYEDDIMKERIRAIFGRASSNGTKRVVLPDAGSLNLGTPEAHQVQDLKRRGRQRGR